MDPRAWDRRRSDCAVSWLPMYHDMGLVGMAIGAVYGSLSAVLLTPQAFVKRPVDWLRAISRHRGTVSFAPNFAYDLAARRVKDTRSRRSGFIVLARSRVRGRADSRADSRRVRRQVPHRPGSVRPAFFPATASPSTCWPQRLRRVAGSLDSNISRPTI